MATRKKIETVEAAAEPQVSAPANQGNQVDVRVQALMIVLGLISKSYAKQHVAKFVQECIELKLTEELQQMLKAGTIYLAKRVPDETMDALMAFLQENSIGETDAG